MQEFTDDVLGPIQVRRHHNARHVRFRLSPKRELIATAPPRMPLAMIKMAARTSRKGIQELFEQSDSTIIYTDNQQVGQSHKLNFVTTSTVDQPTVARRKTSIVVSLPTGISYESSAVQTVAQQAVISAMGREARAYLPRRLRTLADRHGYDYDRVRYTHSTSRWGSCSSTGTISLNIALMKMPLELIDYVLIHELCHTQQMNHSDKFWQLVQAADPYWRDHRRRVKDYSPLL